MNVYDLIKVMYLIKERKKEDIYYFYFQNQNNIFAYNMFCYCSIKERVLFKTKEIKCTCVMWKTARVYCRT